MAGEVGGDGTREPDVNLRFCCSRDARLTARRRLAGSDGGRERRFRKALASRDILGQAKGLLMERYSVDEHVAFDMLKRLSQDTNGKVVHLAQRLIATDHPSATPSSPDKPQRPAN